MESIEEMYRKLIEQAAFYESGSSIYDSDDEEDFITSEEIVKAKNRIEKELDNDSLPSYAKNNVIEEEVYFKRYTKKREHKYTEKELSDIMESCKYTIVHDYGSFDRYHQSDEERASNDMLDEISIKLQGLKRTYRKVDQYIEAMRVVVQAWKMLESKGNFMHSRKEFFQLVAEGKIISNQIIMPKLKRIENYNIDLIIKYISNLELDPSELVPKAVNNDEWDDWYLDDDEMESLEERMVRVLSPEEFEYIEKYQDNPPDLKVENIKDKYIKGYNRRSYISSKNYKKKKGNKTDRYIAEGLHELLNKIQLSSKSGYGYTASSLVTDDMFDLNKHDKSFWDDLRFDGSWTNKDDLFLYDLAVREEMLKQHIPGSSYVTYGDKELSEFFKILENNGVNVIDLRRKMDCPVDGISKSEEAAKKKDNKKIEAAIIQRITKLNKSDKFKKIVSKAETALNKQLEDY